MTRALHRASVLEPTAYHRGLGTAVKPTLRLYPGDTVRTSTVDAGGWGRGAFGERGDKRLMGGNPRTGPFYVEGAEPGDVLVVRLHRVLSEFTVPLHPLLGVVAVAPGGDFVPSSRDSGPFGGNMEYAQLREGTTRYLPDTTMNAYLYLGDGHAAQER